MTTPLTAEDLTGIARQVKRLQAAFFDKDGNARPLIHWLGNKLPAVHPEDPDVVIGHFEINWDGWVGFVPKGDAE